MACEEIKLSWIRQNWYLLVFIASVVAGAALLSFRVDKLEVQANGLEKRFAEYPSKDWFELKFSTIDQSIQEIKDGK
jgi:hypothetical protein